MSLITEEAKKFINKETGKGKPLKIEAGAIRKFAKVIGHTNKIFDFEEI